MIVSLIIVNNEIHEIKKLNKHTTNNMCAINIQESNQQYLSIEIYIHTANNGTLLVYISVNFRKVVFKTN